MHPLMQYLLLFAHVMHWSIAFGADRLLHRVPAFFAESVASKPVSPFVPLKNQLDIESLRISRFVPVFDIVTAGSALQKFVTVFRTPHVTSGSATLPYVVRDAVL